MTVQIALANMIEVCKQFRGLSIDQAEVLKQSIKTVSEFVYADEKEENKE